MGNSEANAKNKNTWLLEGEIETVRYEATPRVSALMVSMAVRCVCGIFLCQTRILVRTYSKLRPMLSQ